jgi:hypothetical protein
LYAEFHDDLEFPSHVNGSQTIDYMLCTPNFVEYVWKMGYIPFYECFDTDHCAIYCDIDNDIIKENKRISWWVQTVKI